MKAAFSLSWIKSKSPRKQRKYRFNAPLHIRGKFMHARLSKDLATKFNKRSATVKKGDKVKLMRGQWKGTEGTVDRVNRAYEKIYVEGVTIAKKDGSTSFYPIHPSNVMIIESKDNRPKKAVEKKAVEKKSTEKKTESKSE